MDSRFRGNDGYEADGGEGDGGVDDGEQSGEDNVAARSTQPRFCKSLPIFSGVSFGA